MKGTGVSSTQELGFLKMLGLPQGGWEQMEKTLGSLSRHGLLYPQK